MNYLTDIYRLKAIHRYSSVPCVHKESVAEHGFFVAAIVLDLYKEYDFYLGDAVAMAVCHDMPELELNDCPYVIKKKYPEIKEAFKICERRVSEKFSRVIQDFLSVYEEQDSITAKIVKLADVMQCAQYAENEVKLGNTGYMVSVLETSRQRVKLIKKELKGYERTTKST